ncbi:MAG: hypothetical protein JO023_18565 [Chloroflexi bacterium]|nr:hypothetical protein [Chloroflexota bacterium]
MVGTITYVMNGAFDASGTSFAGLEASRAQEATRVTCVDRAKPDALREADEVELHWLLTECSPGPA